jgi:uncharacterized circularly permuted ATP-grasp superfamily protein/uncharacterized alpha-E superfamily protein
MSSLFDTDAAGGGDRVAAVMNALAALAKRAPAGHLDGLRVAGSDALTSPWRTFFEKALAAMPANERSVEALLVELEQSQASLTRKIADNGITYNLYSDALAGQARPWSLDLLPMIIDQAQWAQIERGVSQRAELLNHILADVYGEQMLVREGMLPTALVQGHPAYLRPAHGITPRGKTFLHIAAFDLARGPDGNWWVMSQRVQAPSGYALENRMIVSRMFPDAFRALHVDKLVESYKTLINSLMAHSPAGADARVVLLTPGPYSETYFEHVYLARYLGIGLVEGGDLVVRDERVWLKTLKGLEPVDVILRRLDDDFLDPLELRADSTLGIPGMLQAYRAGNVVLANAPGTGFLESAAILGFLPKICKAVMGQTLAIPSIASWWCGERSALRTLMPQLNDYVLKPTFNDRGRRFVPAIGKSLSSREREQWTGRIALHPEDFSAQAFLPLAHNPSWQGIRAAASTSPTSPIASPIASRAAMVRVFAVSNGPGQWHVMPGGLARIAPEGRDVVSMYRGGSSADIWVITGHSTDESVPLSSTLTPIGTHRAMLGIASRAAENLFWFGRYTERLENTTRLARVTLEALASEAEEAPETLEWLHRLALSNGLVSKAVPSPKKSATLFERALIASLGDRTAKLGAYSVAATLESLRFSAFAVRERLALEQWTLVAASATEFDAAMSGAAVPSAEARSAQQAPNISTQQALRALERLTTNVMAMTGAQTDRMTRDDGWRLLSMGRHIERMSTLAEALSEAFDAGTLNSDIGFSIVLSFFDSTITYRSRYLQKRDPQALVELLALDRDNPRSLAWISQTLASRIAKLSETASGSVPSMLTSFDLPHQWKNEQVMTMATASDTDAIVELLRGARLDAFSISDALSQRYFSHAEAIDTVVGA